MDPDPEKRANNCGFIVLLVCLSLGIFASFLTGTLSHKGTTYEMSKLPFSYPKLFIAVVLLGFGFGYEPLRRRRWLILPTIAAGVTVLIWSRFWKAFW